MTQGKDKRVESTHSSVPDETPAELEVRLLRRTVADMQRNMADMRTNQEYTSKLLHDQTASMRQQQEPAQSVKSPEKQYEPETPAKERARKGKMPQEQAYTVESSPKPAPPERPALGVRSEIPARERNSDNAQSEGKTYEGDHRSLLREFRKQDPPRFRGTRDPESAEAWVMRVEKEFDYLRVPDSQKVHLAAYILDGEAENW